MEALGVKYYEKVYAGLKEDCPQELWEEFVKELASQEAQQPHFPMPSERPLEEDASKPAKELLLAGYPVAFVVKASDLSRKQVEALREEVGILGPGDPKVSNFYKSIVGAYTSRKKKLLQEAKVKDKVKEYYEQGMTVPAMAKELKVSVNLVYGLLADTRKPSATALKASGLEVLRSKPDNFYRDKFAQEITWSLEDLVRYVRTEVFPESNLPLKTTYSFLMGLGCTPTEERMNAARRIKSSDPQNNPSLKVRHEALEAIAATYGSLEELVNLYCAHKAGTYTSIVHQLKISTGKDVTLREVEKLITGAENYSKKKSRSESIFVEFVKEHLGLQEEQILRQTQEGVGQGQSTVDLLIPSLNLAFEFNGTYWHSDEVIEYNYGMSAEAFHLKKQEACKSQGVQLLYVWDDDFQKQEALIAQALREKDFSHPIFHQLSKPLSRPTTFVPPKDKQLKAILSRGNIAHSKEAGMFLCENKIYLRASSYKALNERVAQDYSKAGKELFTFFPWYDKENFLWELKRALTTSSTMLQAGECATEVSTFFTEEDKNFLKNNHLLGSPKMRNFLCAVRLKHAGKVVALAVFQEASPTQVELKRVAFLEDYSISGGLRTLVEAFIAQDKSTHASLLASHDCSLGSGKEAYASLGFTLLSHHGGSVVWWHASLGKKIPQKTFSTMGADRLLKSLPGYTTLGLPPGHANNKLALKQQKFKPVTTCGENVWCLLLSGGQELK